MDQCFEGLPIAITVTDSDLKIIDMNQRSADVNSHGSKHIIGNDLMGCHNERSRQIIQHMADTHSSNIYTIEKTNAEGKKVKKLIYQTPWYEADGTYGGLMELSLEIPFEMPHYVRS